MLICYNLEITENLNNIIILSSGKKRKFEAEDEYEDTKTPNKKKANGDVSPNFLNKKLI